MKYHTGTLEERFWPKVSRREETDCWSWHGSRTPKDYGMMGAYKELGKTSLQAHIISYFLAHGIWPSGDIDHLCRNHWCVNPNHLEDVSKSVNTQRGKMGDLRVRPTHCPKGHEYTPETLGVNTTKKGKVNKFCRICHREATKRSIAKKGGQS